MSCRKPQVHYVSTEVFSQPTTTYRPCVFTGQPGAYMTDDLLVTRIGFGWRARFADVDTAQATNKQNELTIENSRVDRAADPLDWFDELIAVKEIKWTLNLNCSRQSTKKRFNNINPLWDRIQVRTTGDEDRFELNYYKVSTSEGTAYENSWSPYHKEAEWRAKWSVGTLLVEAPSSEQLFHVREFGLDPVSVSIDTAYDGESRTIRQGTRIRGIYHLVKLVADKVFADVPDASKRLLPPDVAPSVTGMNNCYSLNGEHPNWELGFKRRQPWYLQLVRDATLAMEDLHLPPYVVLEILDWLPKMELWNHKRKIDLIIAVQRSMRSIQQRRPPVSIKTNRTE